MVGTWPAYGEAAACDSALFVGRSVLRSECPLFARTDVRIYRSGLNLESANGQKRPLRSLCFGRLNSQQMLTEVVFLNLGFAESYLGSIAFAIV